MIEPEKITTNLETERINYRVLVASDVVNGKVVDLEVYILAKVKWENVDEDEILEKREKRELVTFEDLDEVLARRSPIPPGVKVPHDVDKKFREYEVMYPVKESRTVGLDRAKFMR